MRKTRVLIVDDSALIRKVLGELLAEDPAIEVVGTAPDPYIARERIKALDPDVITLDIEMPRMDGLTFLGNLMRLRPTPVVMISSLTQARATQTLRAFELGAVDCVPKPTLDIARGLREYGEDLRERVKGAAMANLHRLGECAGGPGPVRPRASRDGAHRRGAQTIVALGASTGGTEAIRRVLSMMPADAPPMVISQHIPAAFSTAFARRMDDASPMSVVEAADGMPVERGRAYVAPGDHHLVVARDTQGLRVRLLRTEPVNRHRPSVDVMFRSVAQDAAHWDVTVGVLLTGMGEDGARGLLEMRRAGARTLAQDERTSVVWGMPGAAARLGAADELLPLDAVAEAILNAAAGCAAAEHPAASAAG